MATATVEPLFLLRRNLPPASGERDRFEALELCLAAERVSGRETIMGAQEIRGLWRIYPTNRTARTKLLIEGMAVRGHTVTLYDKNPFVLRGQGGAEAPATKLFISNLPLSVSDADIESALIRVGCVMRSNITRERMRDRDGKLTRFYTGRRFIFINVPDKPLDKTLKVGGFLTNVYHKEQPKKDPRDLTCSRCLEVGHGVWACHAAEIVCRACGMPGHRQGDTVCEALEETDGQAESHSDAVLSIWGPIGLNTTQSQENGQNVDTDTLGEGEKT